MAQPEFQTIVAQAPRKRLKALVVQKSTSIAVGGAENTDFYSPAGTISRVVALYIYVPKPPAATSGTHYMQLLNGTSAGHFMHGESNYTDDVFFDFSMWVTATAANGKKPATEEGILIAMEHMMFDSVIPLRFTYQNNSNIATTSQRTIILTIEETTLG